MYRAARRGALLLVATSALTGTAHAQKTPQTAPSSTATTSPAAPSAAIPSVTFLPRGYLFRSLIADPKEPRFTASFIQPSETFEETSLGIVAFGVTIGLLKVSAETPGDGFQVSIAGGVFAQFYLSKASAGLINADYVVGLPITYRRGKTSARFRLYHQSSHLGERSRAS